MMQWISKEDMERLALQQIRSLPGGEFVRSVEVEYVADGQGGWLLHTTATEGGNIELIQEAAKTVRRRLMNSYSLRKQT